jgi:hypothetical protein
MWWGSAIEAPDPGALARFYSQLLGWPIGHEEPGIATLAAPQGSVYLVIQQATDYQAPVWPPADGQQRPMMHFDFQVGLRASVATARPQENVRVLHHADVVALKGDSYRLKNRDLGRFPVATTTE